MLASEKNQRIAFSFALFSLGGLVLLITSSIVYYTFYKSYIPPLANDAHLYFDYSKVPTVSVPVSSLGLMKDQQYSFSLKLVVPNSPHNFKLGNFMVHFIILDSYNKTLSVISRPGLVIYKSPLLLTLNTLASSLWLLLGSRSESQKILIPLLELYSPKKQDHFIQISLSTSDLHVSNAALGVKTYLRGLRYFMYEWPLVTGILIISLILVSQVMLLFGIYEAIGTVGKQPRKLKVKKKQSQLSRKSSVETARFDSSYASLRTITPVEPQEHINKPYYPESPSPWTSASKENTESADEITMESIQDDEKEEKDGKKEGTSYSFFPSKGGIGGASSYSMSFTAAVAVEEEEEEVRDAVESWRESLDGNWNE